MTNREQAFLRIPVPFKNHCEVYPPTIKEVLEEPDFHKYLALLTISQEDIEDQLFDSNDADAVIQEGQIPTPFQYLVELSAAAPEYCNLITKGFKFFTHMDLTFIPQKKIFLFGTLEENILRMKDAQDLDIFPPEDFFEFQNLIRGCLGMETLEPYNYNMPPKLRRMKAKQRLRDRVKAKQNSKNASFLNSLVSICCMGIGITPLNIGEMSYAAVPLLIQKYQMKERYDVDMRILTSGFCSSKKLKPKHWMQEEDK